MLCGMPPWSAHAAFVHSFSLPYLQLSHFLVFLNNPHHLLLSVATLASECVPCALPRWPGSSRFHNSFQISQLKNRWPPNILVTMAVSALGDRQEIACGKLCYLLLELGKFAAHNLNYTVTVVAVLPHLRLPLYERITNM